MQSRKCRSEVSICSPLMLPVTFQFLIAMVAYAMNERVARRLDYVEEEVRVLREALLNATGKRRIAFTTKGSREGDPDVRGCEQRQLLARRDRFPLAPWRAAQLLLQASRLIATATSFRTLRGEPAVSAGTDERGRQQSVFQSRSALC